MATGLNRNHAIALLAAALIAAAVIILFGWGNGPQPLEITFGEPTPGTPGPIEVYITGAVAQPGVYEVGEGDRLIDVLYQAGGPAADANLEAINLSLRLLDEHHIIVPRVGEPSSGLVSGAVTAMININTATAAELDDLPGIGDVYSERIVESRTLDGAFTTIEELVERRVIPRATYDGIFDLITVGP